MAALEDSGIRYLVVGGIAVGMYTEPRFTKDLDVLVAIRPPDHQRLFDLLRDFGAPTQMISPDEFNQPDFVFFFGAPPWRVDILTSIPGVDFEQAYESRQRMRFGDRKIDFISREWLIRAKRASGRAQDLADLEKLEQQT